MKKPKCDACVFRAEAHQGYRCNYVWLMGHTRRAEPPEACTYFRAGKRLESPEKAEQFINGRKRQPKAKTKYDWGRAEQLYREGRNDGEIARVIGCTPGGVLTWRKRKGFTVNARPGGDHRKQL